MKKPANPTFWFLLALLGVFFYVSTIGAGFADDDNDANSLDHVHMAVKRGEIKPLGELLGKLHSQFPGDVIDVEIERENSKWIYEFKLVSDSGRLLEIYMDAATGKILDVEKKR